MPPLSSSALLDLWERGSALHSLDRALLALSAMFPEVPPESLADWPLGQRNRALLELHCRCFAVRLQGWGTCVSCGEKMEFELEGGALLQSHCSPPDGQVSFKEQQFRLPSSRDLAVVRHEADAQAAGRRLLELCCLNDTKASSWADEDVNQIGEQMALADPLAEIRVGLRCPGCGWESVETLDLVLFLWEEIEARAKSLLWEVHSIASVYRWSETEILLMSPTRRRHYLEMVEA